MSTPQGAQRVELPAEGFVGERQILKSVLPVSHSTLVRMCADGKFPKPVKILPRRNLWPVESVRAFIASQAAPTA